MFEQLCPRRFRKVPLAMEAEIGGCRSHCIGAWILAFGLECQGGAFVGLGLHQS